MRESPPAGESAAGSPVSAGAPEPARRLWRRYRRLLFGVISITFSYLGLWAFYLEPSSLVVRRYPIEVTSWRGRQAPLVAALLGDLHVGSPWNGLDKLEEVVARTNAEHPDLIVLAGDYVINGVLGGTFVSPREMTPVLRRLEAPLGIYAVLGNHDWCYDGFEIRRAFEAAGIRVLEDQAICLRRPGTAELWLVGIGDAWGGLHDIPKALSPVPAHACVLAFTHNPDLFPQIPSSVGLTLAAHTHGGQVSFPFIGPPLLPSSFGQRFAMGHVAEEGRQLFVTPGIGTSIFPVRFRVPPEISILELR